MFTSHFCNFLQIHQWLKICNSIEVCYFFQFNVKIDIKIQNNDSISFFALFTHKFSVIKFYFSKYFKKIFLCISNLSIYIESKKKEKNSYFVSWRAIQQKSIIISTFLSTIMSAEIKTNLKRVIGRIMQKKIEIWRKGMTENMFGTRKEVLIL
jgi:hypothetical protein